jgi:hypothetical protein
VTSDIAKNSKLKLRLGNDEKLKTNSLQVFQEQVSLKEDGPRPSNQQIPTVSQQ